MVAGFTSFVSYAGGPPAAIYLLANNLTKTQFQATTVLVFWVVNLMKFVPDAAPGFFTRETFLANIYLAPVAMAGGYLQRIVTKRVYFGLTTAFLLITGAKLIWDAVT